MDQGSELGRSKEIKKLFEAHRYGIRTSAPDMHSQTGQVERPIQTVAKGLRTLLHGSGIAIKYWPYAYYHFELLYNCIPHGDRTASPFTLATGKRPDVSKLRTWGCLVYVRPPEQRSLKLDNHCNIGSFLGFTSTMTQIHYLDHRTKRIKTAAHVRFDEGMNGVTKLPPNARMIRQALGHHLPPEEEEATTPDDVNLFVQPSYFPELVEVTFQYRPSDQEKGYTTLGLIVAEDKINHRGYLLRVEPHSSISKVRGIRQQLMGSYVIEIDGTVVGSKDEIDTALSQAVVNRQEHPNKEVKITFAPDKIMLRTPETDDTPLPKLHSDQLRHVALLTATDDHTSLQAMEHMWKHDPDTLSMEEIDLIVRGVTTVALEKSKFTRRQVMSGPDKDEWLHAEWKQLDAMKEDNMYGKPIPRPPTGIILGVVWTYLIKWNGTKKEG